MDSDENDLIFTNKFINTPVTEDVPSEFNEEFRKYYKEEIEKSKQERFKQTSDGISIKNVDLEEETDGNSLLNTNKFMTDVENLNINEVKRYTREVKTYVNIDSRDRNKSIYNKPNYFKIFLGKTFYNVKSIRLASVEFPNTNAVINNSNNHIFWINQEDIDEDIIDSLTQSYPIYEASLRIGSYIITTLQNEVSDVLGKIKRKNGIGNPHYFVVTMDNDTDIVNFISLDLTQLGNNPISTIQSLTTINLSAPNHGYKIGNQVEIYLTGCKTIAGIPANTLNGSHNAIVLQEGSNGILQFEVNIIASENAIGGGNTVKLGKKTPFQLLFGDNSNTLAPNIGFPIENSSERIVTYIKSIENYYLVKVTTKLETPHAFHSTFDYIGQTCQFSGTGDLTLDGIRQIVKVINPRTFLVQVNSEINTTLFSGSVDIAGVTLELESASDNITQTILIKSFTDHKYEKNEIDKEILFYDTNTTPLLEGTYKIYSVLSPTEFIIQSYVLENISITSDDMGQAGYFPQYKSMKTTVYSITNIVPGVITTIITGEPHHFAIGDDIKLENVITTPPITTLNSGIYKINSIPSPNSFTVSYETTSFVDTTIINQTAIVCSPIVEVTFPNHRFNEIINIQSVTGNKVEIQTKLPHRLVIETGTTKKIRISNSNSIPSIDDSYEINSSDIISDDTFVIPFSGSITIGDYGIIGLSQIFTLYECLGFGGLTANILNNKKYNVRDIIDENNFTFVAQSIATKSESDGGQSIYINSFLHGFNGEQNNTKNSILNRSINLEGENYAFLCCPQLNTMMNTGNVKNIFARILLDESPGHMVFSILSNPKEFDTVPLDKLSDLDFSIVNYDNTLYEFNDLDYSFVLEITEVIDTTESFNISSKRGIINT